MRGRVAVDNANDRAKRGTERREEGKVEVKETLFLTRDELAQRWQMSVCTLENWAVQRKGPVSKKFGRRVMYRLSDVRAYEDEVFGAAS